MDAAWQHEHELRERIEVTVCTIPGVTLHSRASRRTPTLLLTFADRRPGDVYLRLAEVGINAPAGTFYAYEPARRLGLDDGGLRVGLAIYNNDNDVDRLLDALPKALT
jgi:selenocysteine lyase/cysteine desulfurase